MSDTLLWCGKMPNGHLLWETVHFDKKYCRQLTISEHEVWFGKRLQWRALSRRGYRLVEVKLKEVSR